MSRARNLLILRGIWLGLLVWPYAVASGVPRPLALAALPALLALLSGDGALRFALRILAALALGALATLHSFSPRSVQALFAVRDLRDLTSFVTSVLLWCTALLGWQVFRDATSRTRLLWLWLMGALVLGLNHRFWGGAADVPTLAFVGIGLFLMATPEDEPLRPYIALAALVPLLGALAGLFAQPGLPTSLPVRTTRALNLAGLRVAVTPEALPQRISINQPVSLPTTPLLSISGVPRPAYWQEAIYTKFTGVDWVASSPVQTPIPLEPPLLPPAASGLQASIWHVRVTQFVPGSIGPVIYTGTPLALQSDGGAPYEVAAARALYLPGASAYNETLSVPSLTDAVRSTAGYVSPEDVPSADLAVPAKLERELAPLAHRLAAETQGPFALAERITQYLDSHEVYSPNFSPSRTGDPVGRFLLRTHQGYCDQFSTAFIMLARIDGLPARWVVGFAPGPYDAQSHSEVLLAKDAHSWAEIDVAPYGWLPVDPTPSAAPTPSPAPAKAPIPEGQAPHSPQGDILAALLALVLAGAGYAASRRAPGLRGRMLRLERGFTRLSPLQGERPPTLRERLAAQPEQMQEALGPVLSALEQYRYGPRPPAEGEVLAAERALHAAERLPRRRRGEGPPA